MVFLKDDINVLVATMHATCDASCMYVLLYENIVQILPIKLHGPMHYKIGDTFVYSGEVFYTV